MTDDELSTALEASLAALGVDVAEYNVEEEQREYCPGSGKKPKKAGSKYFNGRIKYRCPSCTKHYTTDSGGKMTKHGYRITSDAPKKKGKPKAHCAECRQPVYELDYLCERCRGA